MSNSKNNLANYLKYALGEIVLVTIGILIALYIKGWYQEKEEDREMDRIGMQIIDDLRADTTDVRILVSQFEPAESNYLLVLSDSLNEDSLLACGRCPYLISSINPFIISQNGYSLLKDRKVEYISSKDSLIHDTKIFYETAIPLMDLIVDMIKEEVRGNLDDWSENYSWYHSWVMGKQEPEFIDFMLNDHTYKNQVANFYLLVYRNYLPGMKNYSAQAAMLADRWEKELEKEN